MECESILFVKNQMPYLWDLSNSFSNSFIDVYSLNTCSPVSPTRFRFGGRGWDKGGSSIYLQNGVCRVEQCKIVKAGFHSFRSILDQNALLKASQTSRKCAQEFSSGKEWVLRCLDTFGGRSAPGISHCKVARTTVLYMKALWSGEKGKLSSYCISV